MPLRLPDVIFASESKKKRIMQIVSTREFRANQGRFLSAAKRGQSVILTSRYGNFKITPVTEEDNLTPHIVEALREVKLIETGQLPAKSAKSFLNEL